MLLDVAAVEVHDVVRPGFGVDAGIDMLGQEEKTRIRGPRRRNVDHFVMDAQACRPSERHEQHRKGKTVALAAVERFANRAGSARVVVE